MRNNKLTQINILQSTPLNFESHQKQESLRTYTWYSRCDHRTKEGHYIKIAEIQIRYKL